MIFHFCLFSSNSVLLQCNSDLNKLSIFSSEHLIAKRSIDSANVNNADDNKSKQLTENVQQPKIEKIMPSDDTKIPNVVDNSENSAAIIPLVDKVDKNDKNVPPPQQQPLPHEIESKKNLQESSSNELSKIDNLDSLAAVDQQSAITTTTNPYQCLTNSFEMKRLGNVHDGSLEFNFKVKKLISFFCSLD